MARFPKPEEAPRPASLRPTRNIVREDDSGLMAGLSDLSQGVSSLAGSALEIQRKEKARQNTADISAAEAAWMKGALDVNSRFESDNQFETFEERAFPELDQLQESAAELIRDPEMKKAWIAEVELKKIAAQAAIKDRATKLSHEKDRSLLEGSLLTNAELFADPNVTEADRNAIGEAMAGSITRGLDTSIITFGEADAMKRRYIDGAEESLALNRATLDIMVDPASVMTGSGIPAAMGGSDIGVAMSASGGGIIEIDPVIAGEVAKSLSDDALPSDPEMRKAYLADPEINARYSGEAVDLMTRKYGGDQSAAVIALAPGGGEDLARIWVGSKHNEDVLPPKVRAYYRDVMGRVSAPANLIHFPITAAPGVNLEEVNGDVLDRVEKLQSVFGAGVLISSGKRTPEHNDAVGGAKGSQHLDGNAVDIDTSKMSQEDVIRLIETASAMGFGGIGVYEGSIHVDLGARRSWGPNYHSDSVPGWAADVIGKHVAGTITEVPMPNAKVNPRYAKLSFEQRVKVYSQAKQAMDEQALDTRSSIQVAIDNAPSAILTTGAYDGVMPTVDDFVEGYGGREGIEKFKEFKGQIEVARDSYSMRTMSLDEIASMLEEKAPRASGDMAAYEVKRYQSLVEAAATTKKAREADPAGYTLSVMPNVQEQFDAAEADQNNPELFAKALSSMALAQEMLGIEKPALLPKAMAQKAAADFNDDKLPQQARIGAITSAIFATQDEAHQRAILDQLQTEGVPDYLDPALDALARGDEAGARYLFRAAVVDPKDLPGKLDYTGPQIREEIQSTVYDQGQIGDIVYGITGGTAENYRNAMIDNVLFERAVTLRLADGSATDLRDAVQKTARDMWGDVSVVNVAGSPMRAGLKIALPQGEDRRAYELGFTTLMPKISEALFEQMTTVLAGAPTSDGSAALGAAIRDNDIAFVLENGHFTNMKPGIFVFVDPRDGDAVAGPDGEPLTFTAEEVKAAGQSASSETQDLQRYLTITGGNSGGNNYYDTIGGKRTLTRDPFN
jgi:hypothetical protein